MIELEESFAAVPSFSKIHLRYDQRTKSFINNPNAIVFAPHWVQAGLHMIGNRLHGVQFRVFENGSSHPIDEFTVDKDTFSLIQLQKIARNESSNVSGIYNLSLYEPSIPPELIVGIRDLVRQCIIVGLDTTTHCGGYPNIRSRVKQSNSQVLIADLAGLQFQQPYNTGRLVLIENGEKMGRIKGLTLKGDKDLENLIFLNVVGEVKRTYDEVEVFMENEGKDSDRYVKPFFCEDYYFDTEAYKRFVAADVLLTGLGFGTFLASLSSKGEELQINFKFLKYGTGFFAGHFSSIVQKHIFSGVVLGLVELFKFHTDKVKPFIRYLEFPYYDQYDVHSMEILKELCINYDLGYSFSTEDALKDTQKDKKLITGTSNCGDCCAVMGNEMHFGSVDAAIAENLSSKGNIFCPNINKGMKEEFLNLNTQKEYFFNPNAQKEDLCNFNTQREEVLNLNSQKKEFLNPNVHQEMNMEVEDQVFQDPGINTVQTVEEETSTQPEDLSECENTEAHGENIHVDESNDGKPSC